MTTATQTQSLVAITPGGPITEEHIAGYYFWYSIKEDSLPLRKVRKAFADAGLDESRFPEDRRPEHVAQEAIRKVERITQNGHREEIRVEHPMRDENFLIAQITRHVYDKQQRLVEHPKALRVLFDFRDSTLHFEKLEGATDADVQPLIDEIQGRFDAGGKQMPGYKLRTILRHYVEAAGAENMRGDSGGIYFLAKDNRLGDANKLRPHHGDSISGGDFIARVRHALELLYGKAPSFHSIPCVNDEGQREFLKQRFIENCSEDLKKFRDECLEIVGESKSGKRERGIRFDLRTRLIEQRKEMNARRVKFAEILGETLDELNRDMTLADKALVKFVTEADK